MGSVIRFPIEKARRRVGCGPQPAPATVIILPVIRIERWLDQGRRQSLQVPGHQVATGK
jgi:hypothetical protein